MEGNEHSAFSHQRSALSFEELQEFVMLSEVKHPLFAGNCVISEGLAQTS
jgi:hypothetical protein